MRPISFLDVNIGDLRFFYHRNSPRQDQHVPVHGYHYRTYSRRDLICKSYFTYYLQNIFKIYECLSTTLFVLNCYMNIHFLTVKEYNRTINIFIFHCASDWSNNFEG